MGNIIAISVILLLAFCALHYQYTKRKKKQHGCGEGCNHCPFHNDCHSNEKKV